MQANGMLDLKSGNVKIMSNLGNGSNANSQSHPSEPTAPNQSPKPTGPTSANQQPPTKDLFENQVAEAKIGSEEGEKEIGKEKLEKLAEKVTHPLLVFNSIGVFATTKITLDLRKITIYRERFMSQQVETIPNEDLDDVSIETNIFTATLRIKTKDGQEMVLRSLPTSKAFKAKQILLGLITCIKEGIKLGVLDPEQDVDKLIKIGTANS